MSDDVNQDAAKLVKRITKTPLPRGEDLIGSEELKRQYLAAKEKEAQRKKSKRK